MARSISRRSATSTPTASQYTPEPDTDEQHESPEAKPQRPTFRKINRSADDEAPRATSKGKRNVGPSAAGGWGGYNEEKAKGGKSFGENLKVGSEPKIIAFLEDEPFAVYREHWIKQEGRQSFTCHGTERDSKGKEVNVCPLCEVTDKKPALRVLFNVVTFDDGDPKVVILRAGVQLSDLIHDWATSEKTSPINRFDDADGKPDLYWAIKRIEKKSGGQTKYDYSIVPVKARDLAEEWDIDPLTQAERDELMENLFDAEGTVRIDPVEDLEELAEGLAA
ncbi:hypothetical protein [Nonomuraea sp. SYSU D8015]|uniref:hypothetical protein n=1 Tax=Nonomuraea sp. SYSU D8015 TaxID=2593644 RepID=UPI0016610A98|nr:hypothetical protein [Nonomuraea sp. SYSU D8015]